MQYKKRDFLHTAPPLNITLKKTFSKQQILEVFKGRVSEGQHAQNLAIVNSSNQIKNKLFSPKVKIRSSVLPAALPLKMTNGVVILNDLLTGIVLDDYLCQHFRNRLNVKDPVIVLQIETSFLSLSGHFPTSTFKESAVVGHLIKDHKEVTTNPEKLTKTVPQNCLPNMFGGINRYSIEKIPMVHELKALNNSFSSFRDESTNILHTVINFILVESWKEVIPGQNLEGENLMNCSKYSRKIGTRSEYSRGRKSNHGF